MTDTLSNPSQGTQTVHDQEYYADRAFGFSGMYAAELERGRADRLARDEIRARSASTSTNNDGSLFYYLVVPFLVLGVIAFLIGMWIRGTIPHLWFYEYVSDVPRFGRIIFTMLFVLSQASIISLAYSWWGWGGALLSIVLLPYVNVLASIGGWQLTKYVDLATYFHDKIRGSFFLPTESHPRLHYGWYTDSPDLHLSWMPEFIAYAALSYAIVIPPLACATLTLHLARRRRR